MPAHGMGCESFLPVENAETAECAHRIEQACMNHPTLVGAELEPDPFLKSLRALFNFALFDSSLDRDILRIPGGTGDKKTRLAELYRRLFFRRASLDSIRYARTRFFPFSILNPTMAWWLSSRPFITNIVDHARRRTLPPRGGPTGAPESARRGRHGRDHR